MTALHLAQLSCDVHKAHHYPHEPVAMPVRELRKRAEAEGWEVMHGSRGRDVCPEDRIKEIRAQSTKGQEATT